MQYYFDDLSDFLITQINHFPHIGDLVLWWFILNHHPVGLVVT
jgi:hypothetical protein